MITFLEWIFFVPLMAILFGGNLTQLALTNKEMSGRKGKKLIDALGAMLYLGVLVFYSYLSSFGIDTKWLVYFKVLAALAFVTLLVLETIMLKSTEKTKRLPIDWILVFINILVVIFSIINLAGLL